MKLEVKVMEEHGYVPATLGLGLSKGLTAQVPLGKYYSADLAPRVDDLALRLGHKDGGHNKFLEGLQVWLDVRAPRFWWQEMDTYRVGTSKQSESTMYTLMRGELTQAHFDRDIFPDHLEMLNRVGAAYRKAKADKAPPEELTDLLLTMKANLPEGFLQRRVISTNYKVLRHIAWKRRTHLLPHWQHFVAQVEAQLQHGHFLHYKPREEHEACD